MDGECGLQIAMNLFLPLRIASQRAAHFGGRSPTMKNMSGKVRNFLSTIQGGPFAMTVRREAYGTSRLAVDFAA